MKRPEPLAYRVPAKIVRKLRARTASEGAHSRLGFAAGDR